MEGPLTPTTPEYTKIDDDVDVIDPRYDQNTMSNWKMNRKWVIAVASMLVILCSGGLILGFGPLYTLLVEEGQWSEKCEEGEELDGVTCAQQEVYLQYIFSTAFLCLSLSNAVFGLMLDIIGPRLSICIGLLISLMGNIMLAFGQSTVGDGYSIIIGYTCVGIGGYSIYICSFQLTQLFERQGFITSVLSGLFNTSGYIYMLLNINGMKREPFFIVYTFLILACLVISFVFYPLNSLTKPNSHLTMSGFNCRLPRIQKPMGLWAGLKPQLLRADLWYFAAIYGWISCINSFLGGAIPNIIYRLAGEDADMADAYVNYISPSITNGSFIFTPIVGWAIDKYGCKIIFFATLLSVHGILAMLFVKSLHAQLVTLFLFSFEQSAFYSLQFAYVVLVFPKQVYGSVQSFLAMSAFLMCLLNYIFNPWVQNQLDGNYNPVFIIMMVPIAVFYFLLFLIRPNPTVNESQTEQNEKLSVKVSVQ